MKKCAIKVVKKFSCQTAEQPSLCDTAVLTLCEVCGSEESFDLVGKTSLGGNISLVDQE